jgi:4-hydroxybenzoate polyprenyltransferase
MMGRALLVVGWVATIGLLITGVAGYLFSFEEGNIGPHLTFGLASSLLLLFSHCWIMFYLIGTGKAIREAVAEHGLDQDLVERTKEFKNRSYPILMLAMGLVMAVFILGGGVYTRFVPAWLHHGLFYLALLVQVRTLLIERQVLVENDLLMTSIDRRIRSGMSG